MNAPTWTGLAVRGEERDRLYKRYESLLRRREGRALAICDLLDFGHPVKGKPLRRFRRLDRMVKACYRRLFSHPLRAETPPLGGIDG